MHFYYCAGINSQRFAGAGRNGQKFSGSRMKKTVQRRALVSRQVVAGVSKSNAGNWQETD